MIILSSMVYITINYLKRIYQLSKLVYHVVVKIYIYILIRALVIIHTVGRVRVLPYVPFYPNPLRRGAEQTSGELNVPKIPSKSRIIIILLSVLCRVILRLSIRYMYNNNINKI